MSRSGPEGGAVPVSRLPFAVVDVETTGLSWRRGGRITEVAVVHLDDGRVGESYQSLVNPGRPIPPWIQRMTGITDAMVDRAPPFEDIAWEVESRLRGRIFVAHNERFDWGFVRSELIGATGEAPEPDRLCTVRLGRRLVPFLPRHGLDALTAHFRIPVEDRHRAHGDALATARLLLHLLEEAQTRGATDLASLGGRASGGGWSGGARRGRT